MKYDHNQYLESLATAEEERGAFAENFAHTDVAARHDDLVGRREAAFQEHMESGGQLKKLVDEIRQGSPTLPIESIYLEAGRRMGVFQ